LYGSQFRLEGLGFVAASEFLGGAVALSWFGSWLAATRHIRGIEPT
jgi:cell division protein FtsX